MYMNNSYSIGIYVHTIWTYVHIFGILYKSAFHIARKTPQTALLKILHHQ